MNPPPRPPGQWSVAKIIAVVLLATLAALAIAAGGCFVVAWLVLH